MTDFIKKDRQFVWHPYTSLSDERENIFIESAQGAYLNTPDGRKILDAVSSWWVNIHGHSNPAIAEAIARQAAKLEHVIFAGFTHEPAVSLAERLLAILPGTSEMIFYSDNGSTAVEVALKMALQYWYNLGQDKKKIVAMQGAYHGDTFGAMSTSERSAFTKPFSSHLFEVSFIDFPDGGNDEAVLNQFRLLAKNGDVAAFLYEPLVQGTAGMRIYSAEILDKILDIAKQENILCIADEVMTGFGRTGKLFASEYLQHQPDILCLSKALTGGVLPLGVTACNARIVSAFRTEDRLKTFFHGHSFTANPISCASALASMDLLLKEECIQNIQAIANDHKDFCLSLKDHKNLVKINSLGTILRLEIRVSGQPGYFSSLRDYCYDFFLKRDILLRPLGNVIYFFPPYIVTKEERKRVYDAMRELLNSL
ncbi:MAG: adenosylmethionine--8-amino-7-oxononanoate transaminase [Cytophagaceae bacterium]